MIVPPSTMLLGYLALLREAAKADAGRREMAPASVTRTAAAHHARGSPFPSSAVPAAPPAPPPDAKVIDISPRTIGSVAGRGSTASQYADAKLRAVEALSVS